MSYYGQGKNTVVKIRKMNNNTRLEARSACMCMCVYIYIYELPWWFSSKESACNAADTGLIPGLGRSPGREHSNPLQYSCLKNPMTEEAGGLQYTGSQSQT